MLYLFRKSRTDDDPLEDLNNKNAVDKLPDCSEMLVWLLYSKPASVATQKSINVFR